jgi:hypothetical protein
MPKADKATLEQEREELELELLREQVSTMKSKRQQRIEERQRMAETFAANERNEAARRAVCRHRKGGKNKEGFLNGSDNFYSVIHHTYPTGQLVVMCTRCQNEWKKPPLELRKSDPKEYRRLMEEYQTALNWPTDNEPSGTQIFMLDRTAAPETVAAD